MFFVAVTRSPSLLVLGDLDESNRRSMGDAQVKSMPLTLPVLPVPVLCLSIVHVQSNSLGGKNSLDMTFLPGSSWRVPA